MRVMNQTINYIRYACSSKTLVLLACLLAAFGAAAMGIQRYSSESNASAMVRDCDDNAIVRCGVANYGELTAAYDANQNGDVRAIFDHYWIKRTLPAGAQVFDGQAKSDGTVTANGRVVATNASSIGRQAIMHSRPISINGKTYHETSHVGGKAFKNPNASLEALVVLDANGNFMYAIVKACGNPIYATPVPPPAPEPKNIQVCDLASKKIVTIKEDQFDAKKHSKNLEDCTVKKIQVCDLATKKVITINEDQFDAKKHSKNLADCEAKPIKVCDLASKKIVTINEDQFDAKKHSKNLDDCKEVVKMVEVCDTKLNTIVTVSEETAKQDRYSTNLADCETKQIQVCEVETKKVITIDEKDFDASKHSKDLKDCETPVTPPTPETPTPEAPAELPKTGMADTFSVILGLTSMSLAAYYYALSRR